MSTAIKLRSWRRRNPKPRATIHLASSLSDNIGATNGHLSPEARRAFLQKCWNLSVSDKEWTKANKQYDSYFTHYEESCRLERPDVLLECPHDKLCHSLSTITTETREDFEKTLSTILPAPTSIPRDNKSVVTFIGKAILKIDLIDWRDQETLSGYVSRAFGTGSTQTRYDRLPLAFNAASFDTKAGIRVRWQHDLKSHLEIVFGESTLDMFHDIVFLDLLQQSSFKNVFPPHFIEETRRSINLLLPRSEPSCRYWLEKQSRRQDIGVSIEGSESDELIHRNLYAFKFWRDRLIIAKDVFDTSQPQGFRQLIRDDRNKVQYWTFWIAFIVFWLTLGSFVATCLQTYKAFYPSPQPPWPGS